MYRGKEPGVCKLRYRKRHPAALGSPPPASAAGRWTECDHFVLMRLVSASRLQAFATGVSLCSISIGTTFTTLSTTGLAKTRLGVLLGGAAMMEDVAGWVQQGPRKRDFCLRFSAENDVSNITMDSSLQYLQIQSVRAGFVPIILLLSKGRHNVGIIQDVGSPR